LAEHWLTVLTFAVLAIGMNVVVGYAGLLDLGYAAFFAIGSYTTALCMSLTDSLFGGVADQGIMAGIFGVIIGAPTLRLPDGLSRDRHARLGEITRLVLTNLDITGGPRDSTSSRAELFASR